MKNSQLTKAIQALSKEEFKELGKFINSPFFNNREAICRFYEAIKKSYPHFRPANFTKEYLFKRVYPAKKYSDVLMRKLVSLMLNLVLEFLLVLNQRQNTLEGEVRLLEILRQRKLLDIFGKKQKKVLDLINNSKHEFDLYELLYKATASMNGVVQLKDEKEMLRVYQKEHDEFVAYFLSFVLLQYIRLSEWSKMYKIQFELRLFNQVTDFLSKNQYNDYPLIPLYYNLMMLMNTGEEKYFTKLFQERLKYLDKVTVVHNYNIALVLIQHCYKMIQSGKSEYRQHQFELTRSIIENNLIPEGYIEHYFFTNTIRYVSYLKEFKWCEDFILKFGNNLDPEIKDEILNYSYSMIEFHKGNYERSLKYLSAINIDKANMKYDIKNIQLMNLYELGHGEQLLSHIDAYKHFVSRDEQLTVQFKEKVRKFLSCVITINRLRLDNNAEEARYFEKEIYGYDYFYLKEWVLEKIGEIK